MFTVNNAKSLNFVYVSFAVLFFCDFISACVSLFPWLSGFCNVTQNSMDTFWPLEKSIIHSASSVWALHSVSRCSRRITVYSTVQLWVIAADTLTPEKNLPVQMEEVKRSRVFLLACSNTEHWMTLKPPPALKWHSAFVPMKWNVGKQAENTFFCS